MTNPRIGFIGLGEAAYNIARGLKKEGIDNVMAYDKYWNVEPQAAVIQKRSREAGVLLAPSLGEMAANSDYIFSAVSANLALPLAKEIQPYLREGQYFVDINAASPMTKEEIAAVLEPANAFFVDVAVMGPVPNYGHKVPILACGHGAKMFCKTFKEYGMNLTWVGEKAGSASALKMFRSIFMKGFVMLLLESIIAGHRYGVEEQVLASIEETITEGSSFMDLANGLLTRGVIHSERREHEMDEVIATLKSINVDDTMSKAAKEKLRWCTNIKFREYFQGIPPQNYQDILAAYEKLSRNSPES